MAEYERILLVKSEVFVYKIPPRTTNRGYRANDWSLNNPDWTGRFKLISKDKACFIKLEDKTSGALFAQCPIEAYPGVAVEAVSDSSRYFVLRIQDDNGRNAFIGVGFADRSDSFDMNVALQDFFKGVQKEEAFETEKEKPKPSLDLGFKEGETIKINMKITKKEGDHTKVRNKGAGSSGGIGGSIGILPPPPTAAKPSQPAPGLSIGQPPASNAAQASSNQPNATAAADNPNWVQF